MTYTPGEIRAAEDVSLDSTHPAGDYFVMVEKETWQNALALSSPVLRHRDDDYDSEGKPLPLTPEWCDSFGHGVIRTANEEYFKRWENCITSEDELYIWFKWVNREGLWTAGVSSDVDALKLTNPTRPQLRALIEVMG